MKKIVVILGILITLAATGSAGRVVKRIHHLKGISEQPVMSDINASLASGKPGVQHRRTSACGLYHRKTYE